MFYVANKKRKNKEWQLRGSKNRHHDLARSRGGTFAPRNIYHWDISSHNAFHFLFGNMTLLEASEWLKTIDKQKELGNELDIMVK